MSTEYGMSGRPKDLEGAFEVYVTISRKRDLTDEELARCEYLIDRMNAQKHGARYREKHMDRVRSANRAWREGNPAKVRAIGRRYHERHRTARNEQSRNWYHANLDKATERNRSRPIATHAELGGRALCGRSPEQGKRYAGSDNPEAATCNRCLQMLAALEGNSPHCDPGTLAHEQETGS